MKIALNSDGFYEWGGGIDLLIYSVNIRNETRNMYRYSFTEK